MLDIGDQGKIEYYELLAKNKGEQVELLTKALKELLCITETHQKSTGNSFAWAEVALAKEALNNITY